MIKIGVLGSTRGSDLPAIVESINNGELKGLAEIAIIISNKKDSGILKKAESYGIENYFVNPKDRDGKKLERIQYDIKIDEIFGNHNVELVTLIGYMRYNSNWFVDQWRNKCMNIHPSLLPVYAGWMDLDIHEEVIKKGCKITGCSLIFIDEGADTGPIILKKTVPVYCDDSVDSLKARVQGAEQEIYPKGIKLYAEGRLKIEGGKVTILNK